MSRLNVLVVVLSVSLVSGCASTRTAVAPDSPTWAPRQTQVDERYVSYVNALAKQRGTRVYWVNPPVKTVTGPIAAR
ncbi:hypothetical protein [Pseudoxanthomonas mexicana]